MVDTELKPVSCPYCGEPIDLIIDTSVESQQYIEDCQVCCRPITVKVSVNFDDPQQPETTVEVFHENEC